MDSKSVVFVLSLMAWLMVTAAANAAGAGKLTVHFTGVDEQKGEVLLSLASSREMFESDDEAVHSAALAPEGKRVTAVFESIPAGEYAVKVFHDANSNKKLDIGWTGPEEKFGFSNNVMGFMGPPDFDDAKFDFDGGDLTVEIDAR